MIRQVPCRARSLPGRIAHLRSIGSYVQVPEPQLHEPDPRMRASGSQLRSDRSFAQSHAVRLRMLIAHPPITNAHVQGVGQQPLINELRLPSIQVHAQCRRS